MTDNGMTFNHLAGQMAGQPLRRTSDRWLFIWLAVLNVAICLVCMRDFPYNLKSMDELVGRFIIIVVVSFLLYIPSLVMSNRGAVVVFSGPMDYILSHGWLLVVVFAAMNEGDNSTLDFALRHRYLMLVPVYSLLWMLFGGFRRWNSLKGAIVSIGGRTFAVLFVLLAVVGFLGKILAEHEAAKKNKRNLDSVAIIIIMALAALISFFYRKGIRPLYYNPMGIARMRDASGFTNIAMPGVVIQAIIVAMLYAVTISLGTTNERELAASGGSNKQGRQIEKECATILGPQAIADETAEGKEFRTKILLFCDLLRKAGVPDEALRDSYASGGFEALHNVSTTELNAKLNDGYILGNLINSLNKGLLEIGMPEWERHELKIRRCLDSLLPQSERWRGRFGDVMTWEDNEEILMLEAIEIIRSLQSIKTIDGFLVSSSMDAPTTSKECAEMIVREQNCPAIVEKWIERMGTWTIAWGTGTPANAPGSTPILISPSFPIQEFLNGGKRFDEVFILKSPALLVLKNGKMHILHSNHKYSWFELVNEAQSIGGSRGIAYLTPTGMIQPLAR